MINLMKLYRCILKSSTQSWSRTCHTSSFDSLISPSNVLSNSNKHNCINSLKSFKVPDSTTFLKKAAVLVPLCEINNQMSFLYTVRSFHLKLNGGEVAFPGGMYEPSDGSLEVTALREAEEEVGILPNTVDVWGKGPEINRKDVCVTPFLGYIGQIDPEQLKINFKEVASMFSVTLAELSNCENFRYTRFRIKKRYVYDTPVYLGGNNKIWGLTGYITHVVLTSLIPEYYKKNIQFQPTTQRVLFCING